jgi:capsule polysaccharide export protein KpsE/RkpR
MEIDKDTIKTLILESLEDSLKEQENMSMGNGEEELSGWQQLESSIEKLQKEIASLRDENESLRKQLDQKRDQMSAPPSREQVAMQESFQIRRSRLAEIVKEEMKKAKDQGIL